LSLRQKYWTDAEAKDALYSLTFAVSRQGSVKFKYVNWSQDAKTWKSWYRHLLQSRISYYSFTQCL